MGITQIFPQICLKLLISIYHHLWCYTNDKHWCSEKEIPKVILIGVPWEAKAALCSLKGPTLALDGGRLGPQI